jgi:nucleoid DNA-binding protein
MRKKDISAVIAQEYKYSNKKAHEIVTRVFALITEALENNEEVSITRFGKFCNFLTKPKKYFNFKTKEQYLHKGGVKKVKFVSYCKTRVKND